MPEASLLGFMSRLPRPGQHTIVTFNIHTNGIRFLALNAQKIAGWGDKEIDEKVVNDGLIVSPALISDAINSIISELNMPDSARIVSTVSGMRSLPRLIHLPKIEQKLLSDAVRFESERQMPLPLNELFIAEKQLDDSPSGHVFYVVGISNALFDAHHDSLSQANLKSYEVDIKPIALARFVGKPEALILDLEPGYTEIVLVMDGVPILMRTIIMGGQYMPFEDRVRQVAMEVSRTIEYYNSKSSGSKFGEDQSVFLTGKLAYSNSLVELLKSSLANPIENAKSAIEFPDQFPVSEYAVNLGLAVKKPLGYKSKSNSQFPAMDLEIVPPDYNFLGSPMKGLLLGLLALLVLVLLIPMAKLDRDRTIEAAELSEQLEQLNESLLRVREVSKGVRETKRETATLLEETGAILGEGGSVVVALEAAIAGASSSVTLGSISISDTEIGIAGTSEKLSDVILYAENIEALEGISNVRIASMKASEDPQAGENIVEFSIVSSR